jgi:hypothetical protein
MLVQYNSEDVNSAEQGYGVSSSVFCNVIKMWGMHDLNVKLCDILISRKEYVTATGAN